METQWVFLGIGLSLRLGNIWRDGGLYGGLILSIDRKPLLYKEDWRREGDSNPRYLLQYA